jgi:hypothetical protein
MNAFTISPLNEASDNLAGFGSAAGLTQNGTDWINTYYDGVLKKIAKLDKRIPLMIQDCFKGASFWAPFYNTSTNIVFDSHVYYFAAAGTYSNYVNPAVCGQASFIAEETKFPVFIGEWSLQAMYARLCSTLNATHGRSIWLVALSGPQSATRLILSTERVHSASTGATLISSIRVSSPRKPRTHTVEQYAMLPSEMFNDFLALVS